MTVPDTPYLRTLRTLSIDPLTLLIPVLSKYLLRELPGTSDTCKIAVVEHVHNLVRYDQGFVLQTRITWEGL